MPLRRKNWTTEAKKLGDHEQVLNVRTRFTAAELTTTPGATLLPAISRGRYRIIDAVLIAIGGAAGGATSINIFGTRAGASVNLMVGLVAGLTQGALLDLGIANGTALTDGGSTDLLDVNTPITVGRVGSALTGATAIDVIVTYALETASMMSGT